MSAHDIITFSDVNHFFREDGKHVHALRDIDLKVRSGEFLVLLGPSGSGKSTILRLMAGLIEPTSGKIIVKPGLHSSFIFQNFALFPWLTVHDNISFGLRMQGKSAEECHNAVDELINEMSLHGFAHSYPHELSGGMKQRVGVARALAVNPDVIFLDEPFSALDSFTTNSLRQELLDIWMKRKVTVVMVTHLIEEAVLLADRIAVLGARPATIEALVTNDIPRPRNHRSLTFFKMVDQLANTIKI